jgi:hypothetical protein
MSTGTEATPPTTLDLFILKDPKQPDLRGDRQLAHLVEEYRPLVSPLEEAPLLRDGTGKCTLLMPEKLAVEQGLGNCAAVDLDKRTVFAGRRIVNQVCNDVLAESLITAFDGIVPWTRVKEYRVCDAKSGEVTEKIDHAGFLVRRQFLEKELAARAVRAGVHLFLRARVVKLLKGA